MKFLLVIAMLWASPGALACELALVAPARSALKKPVQVKASLADGTLTVSYSVTAPLNAGKVLGPQQHPYMPLTVSYSVTAPLNAGKVLGPQQHPYMFDVVELFVTFSETGFPYFEFEVSPFNQTFQVKIVSRTRHQEGVDLGLVSAAAILPHGWIAELQIPLKPLGWDGDIRKIRGNFYSILERTPRSYWSSFLPRAGTANFHQPQFFQPLLQCG